MHPPLSDLKTRAENWLQDPARHGLASGREEAGRLIAELGAEIAADPKAGRAWGPLMGNVRRVRTQLEQVEEIRFATVGSGALAVGHRPKAKRIRDLRFQGAGFVLTLLSAQEGARAIGQGAARHGLDWIWFPMTTATPPPPERNGELATCFRTVRDALRSGQRGYIHCSAGIHRTGMITYALLRFMGAPAEKARNTLKELRQVTGVGVGCERLAWGDAVVEQLDPD
jgi:protein-tyrosine phosphatase